MAIITKPLLKSLRDDLNQAIADVAQKHGVGLAVGNATFMPDGSSGNFKLLIVAGGASTPASAEAARLEKAKQDFERFAVLYGLKEEWFGQEFKLADGRMFRIVGMLPKSHKFPVLAEELGAMGGNLTGKRLKFPAATIIERFRVKEAFGAALKAGHPNAKARAAV